MTIKQHGGIFGRNPTYYNAEIENNLQVSGTSNLDGSVVINESGADVDFRIESDTNTHAFFLNGANGNTGVGTSAPSALFQVGVPLTSTAGIRVSGSNLNVDAGYQSSNVNGTQAAPALIIGGDANTGFFHPASDTLAVSTAAVERLRFEPAGNITVSSGNLVIGTSGKGIDFSATSGTGTSELFDDYEEGTWTPEFSILSGSFSAITYSGRTGGWYTKWGNTVHVSGYIATDSLTVGTDGSLRIGGLPFTSAGTGLPGFSERPPAYIGTADNWGTSTPIGGFVYPSTTLLFLHSRSAVDGASSAIQASNMGTGSQDNELAFAATYTVD